VDIEKATGKLVLAREQVEINKNKAKKQKTDAVPIEMDLIEPEVWASFESNTLDKSNELALTLSKSEMKAAIDDGGGAAGGSKFVPMSRHSSASSTTRNMSRQNSGSTVMSNDSTGLVSGINKMEM